MGQNIDDIQIYQQDLFGSRHIMKNLRFLVVIALVIVTFIIALYYMSITRNEHVVNGILDVKENLNNQDVISLDGQWQFYWNQLLEPKDFTDDEV